ncbi:sensor histidine kinase [Streptomyces sp. NBC_01465]|uniref:sensor histidine kinase n=1 Tax=Streptomyces sp. NBC_01465 TaxID=2903878 RepID=UPI002E31771F|nr:histidine kinase [Streptomyces sp. NBC_01465]
MQSKPLDTTWRTRAVDLALWVLVSVPVTLKADGNDGGAWWQIVLGVAALGLAVGLSRRRPLLSLLIAVGLSLAVTPEMWTSAYGTALVLFGYLAGRRLERARPALVTFCAVAVGGLVLSMAVGDDLWAWLTQLTTLVFTVVIPWLIGRYVRQYAQLVSAGWELADRLEREQQDAADRARLRERSRIAGDMHDSLGHDLALIAVRAAALEVDRALGPQQQAAAGELRAAAGAATARLRDVIGVLREDDAAAPVTPADETVAELVKRAQESGMAVELAEEGPESELAPMTGRALHRTVQEALTNAAKHAPGARVAVSLVRTDSALTVTVTGAPRPAGPLPGATGSGTGLVGLDERVRLAGGALTHGPTPEGGFAVCAVLPYAPGPASAARAPESTTSARELAHARKRVRRGLAQAIWIPVAVVAGLACMIGLFSLYTQYRSVLDRADYDRIRVGQSTAQVDDLLPPYDMDGAPEGAPPEPAGEECAYYRTRAYDSLPAYRLCYRDGRLTSKAVVGE